VIAAAYEVRRRYFGRRVKLNYLLNAKAACARRTVIIVPSPKSLRPPSTNTVACPWKKPSGWRNARGGACRAVLHGRIGARTRRSGTRSRGGFRKAVRARYPKLEICCLPRASRGRSSDKLKAAGVDAVNHNLNTSRRYYGEICQSHTYSDRVDTVEKVQKAGLSACSGALVGMGESAEDILDLAYALRELNVESLPVNFLMPIPGTRSERTEPRAPRPESRTIFQALGPRPSALLC